MAIIPQGIKTLWNSSLRNRALLVASPLAFALLVGLWVFRGRQTTQYYTAKVDKGDISQVVSATGTINAVITVQVGSQVSGNVDKLFVDFNSHVKKGALIAQIDPAIFAAQLEQAQADLHNSEANVQSLQAAIETQRADLLAQQAGVEKAQAQLGDAQLQWKRNKGLADQGIVPAQQADTLKAVADAALASLHEAQAMYEQSKAKLNSSIANLAQAKAQVEQKRATVNLARLNVDHCKIYAPIDGTVVARNVDVGQTVAASLQAPVLFTIAQDLTKMQVYAKTDEADVGRIKVGATATFKVDSFPRETFTGRVSQIRMNATTIQNVVTYDTIVEFDNPDQKLFPGMTAYVNIPVAWEHDAVKIPNGALRFKPEMTDEQRKVLFAKYSVTDPAAARPGGRLAGGPSGGGNGSPNGQGRMGRPPGGGAGAGGGAPGGSVRDDYGIVWKLHADKTLEPARVKLGVTDFTFTAMKEGTLVPGDELVIGQSSKTAQKAQPGGPAAPGGPRRF
ncbi:MAG TPA: efflux RND transporter periplasmic adaptor subunit [Candidatus Acidoferrales bacterium]|nr:efflux RND transporter periplasmic adaptor subunit [Candidatus Acidoferrales bacterium]